MLFMIIYYRAPGVIASIALCIYSVIVFAIFKLIPVTLTLAGIAGFILSIGMAVAGHILFFLRAKKELKKGRRPFSAKKSGFYRACTRVFFFKIFTLITFAILFFF